MTPEELKLLKDAQDRAAFDKIEAAKQQKLNENAMAKSAIAPQYQDKRFQTNTQSQVKAKNFAEFMAQRNQTNAGIAAQAEMSRQNVDARNIGDINNMEQSAIAQNQQQEFDINNTASNQLQEAYNTNNVNYGKDIIAMNKYNQEQAYKRERDKISDNQFWANYNKTTDKSGTINSINGVAIPKGTGVKGVLSKDGKSVIYTFPKGDGSLTQFSFDIGVNPYTGTKNPALIDKFTGKYNPGLAMPNGYQPKFINERVIKPVGKIYYNDQEQNLWSPVNSDKVYVWDGNKNKYVQIEDDTKKPKATGKSGGF